ncbi:MAG: spore coat associated protein CotJA [Oscillospiraceae bacterium]|nr:spore coat associated protein CotJA [Oscillospiraceae bacterium]
MDMMPMPGIPFPGMYMGPRQDDRRPLAMAFVTPQAQITNVFAADEALRMGTLFPELFKPFMGKRGEHG